MSARFRAAAAGAALAVAAVAPQPVAAQQTTLKGGIAVSRFATEGVDYWDDSVVGQSFGIAVRLRVGPIALQPEALFTTRGASASTAADLEQMRLEHVELPLLLIVPVRVGSLEPYALAGPSIMLESRCRHVVRENGIRTRLDCDVRSARIFERTALDWAVTLGAGASHRFFGGTLSLEARHLRGLRNIYEGPGGGEVYNRSWAVLLGYAVSLSNRDR